MNTQIQNSPKPEFKEKRSDESLAKIAITKEADRAVNNIMARISDGFDAGKVVKQNLVSAILIRFSQEYTEADIHDIRMQFFDPIQLMEAMVKKAKETGELPESMRDTLYKQFSASNASHKKAKKLLSRDLINDNVSELESE